MVPGGNGAAAPLNQAVSGADGAYHLRPSDTLGRYGGEEFAGLLPGCALDDATSFLERLRKATPRGVTASVGVAERTPGETPADVLARADAALYLANDTGRNRVRAA
jgi:diguanylate cyclase (GGDEF)-like protein